MGIRDRQVRSLSSKNLPLIAVGSNPVWGFGFFPCEEAIQLIYGTSVVLLICLPDIMHKVSPPGQTGNVDSGVGET